MRQKPSSWRKNNRKANDALLISQNRILVNAAELLTSAGYQLCPTAPLFSKVDMDYLESQAIKSEPRNHEKTNVPFVDRRLFRYLRRNQMDRSKVEQLEQVVAEMCTLFKNESSSWEMISANLGSVTVASRDTSFSDFGFYSEDENCEEWDLISNHSNANQFSQTVTVANSFERLMLHSVCRHYGVKSKSSSFLK